MRDFTLNSYRHLLLAFQQANYTFLRYEDYCRIKQSGDALPEWFVILRHDVDLKPNNSLATARIEAELGIKAVYYFRAVPESWDEKIINEIASLGHEIGYHYESLTTCNGDVEAAYQDFVENIKKLRQLVLVETICMHGSPRSPFDSKDIWKKYDYKELSIIGEPYLDTDFSQLFYITDTGRRWDGYKVSVRDKIPQYQEEWTLKGWTYHGTQDVINAIKENRLPHRVMMTTHPQRWNELGVQWMKELMMQNLKNVVKRAMMRNCM
ncbi:MAG: hypothetical protein PHR53_04545 [Bacteroidales bacterium]|nr:hypothetical protein [Bacteroidales bacterium]